MFRSTCSRFCVSCLSSGVDIYLFISFYSDLVWYWTPISALAITFGLKCLALEFMNIWIWFPFWTIQESWAIQLKHRLCLRATLHPLGPRVARLCPAQGQTGARDTTFKEALSLRRASARTAPERECLLKRESASLSVSASLNVVPGEPLYLTDRRSPGRYKITAWISRTCVCVPWMIFIPLLIHS